MIPVNTPLLDGNEKKYLIECIESGWISSEGPFVQQFEERFAAIVGRKHGIAVSNGTVAIDIVVESLAIGLGDEVILPAFTIISCISQLVRAGATPVLVDCDPDTWNMDVAQIEAKITPRTKAILAVHIYGLPTNMQPLLDIAKRYGITVIEDAAEMHGQTYRNLPCGGFGEISTFSFYPNKLITTGEGGMIVTDNDSLAENCRELRNLCFQPKKRFVHERLGWNARMTNLQAALGLAQLERLDALVEKKRHIGKLYSELLAGTSGLKLPVTHTDYSVNIFWVFGMVLEDCIPFDADEAISRLGSMGIGCRPFFCPMHLQPVLLRKGFFENEKYPESERLWRRGFYVPSGMALTDDHIHEVARRVREILS